MKKLLLFSFFFFSFVLLQAQNNPDIKRTWHWYFGNKAGLDFSNGSPLADTSGQMWVWEGSASISDTNGNLLFYTDGIDVWNRNHQLMPNTGLVGIYGTTDVAQIIAVPQPGDNKNLYYIFTLEYDTSTGNHAERDYAIVDMSQNGGLGDVVSKRNFIIKDPTEKIAAVMHHNKKDIWIVINKMFTNSFYAYLLTNAGLNLTPVISNVGYIDIGGSGILKFSPRGDIAAMTITGGNTPLTIPEILNFNDSTGVFSNAIYFPTDNYIHSYGLEFSPDQTKLYFDNISYFHFDSMNISKNSVYQLTLTGDSTDIINSKIRLDTLSIIDTTGNVTSFRYGQTMALQAGSDGKIYCTKTDKLYIGVISDPNLVGLACNYIDSALYLNSKISGIGFPYYMNSWFYNDTGNSIIEIPQSNKALKIYPNPFRNIATVEIYDNTANYSYLNVEAYDMMGRKYEIEYSVLQNDNKNSKLNISKGTLAPGIYLLSITLNQKKYSQKIIITN